MMILCTDCWFGPISSCIFSFFWQSYSLIYVEVHKSVGTVAKCLLLFENMWWKSLVFTVILCHKLFRTWWDDPGVKLRNIYLCLCLLIFLQARVTVTNREVYGAHYDNGRITRTTDMDPVWARISKESQIRYRALESHSGIHSAFTFTFKLFFPFIEQSLNQGSRAPPTLRGQQWYTCTIPSFACLRDYKRSLIRAFVIRLMERIISKLTTSETSIFYLVS